MGGRKGGTFPLVLRPWRPRCSGASLLRVGCRVATRGRARWGLGEAAPSPTPAAPASLLSTCTVCRSSALAQMASRVATRGAGAGMGGGGHANNPAFMFQSDYAKNKWKAGLFCGIVCAVAQPGQSAPSVAPRMRPLRLLRAPLAALGSSALPSGERPGHWASGLYCGCSSGEPPPRPVVDSHGLGPSRWAAASRGSL